MLSSLFLSFLDCLGDDSVSQFLQNVCWDFDWDWLGSVDQFGDNNFHPNNIKSSGKSHHLFRSSFFSLAVFFSFQYIDYILFITTVQK